MKKGFFLFLTFTILIILPLFADWKSDVKEFLGAAKDYPGLSDYLTLNFNLIPENDKPTASILISYSFHMQKRDEMEYLWIKKYFNDYNAKEPDISFLPVSFGIRLLQYRTEWLDTFPGIKNIRLSGESRKFNYFSPPGKISIELELCALCNYKLYDESGKLLKSGELILKKGKIDLPIDNQFLRKGIHKLKLVLATQKYSNEREFIIKLKYSYPENVEFSPEKGTVKIKGKDFKKEDEERIRVEKRRYFDKEYFKKKAIPYYIAGGVFFVGDQYGLKKVYNSDSLNASLQASVDGTRYLVKGFAISFSLKAIFETINSYKTEVKRIPYTVKIKEAVEWNKRLRNEISEAKKKITVLVSIKNSPVEVKND